MEWLYPTGAIIVNLRPNTVSPATARLSVCIKPSKDSTGTNIYLDRNGKLRLLLREQDQGQGRVHCFGIQEGALFIEAVPHMDISRRITAFQYELVSDRLRAEALLPSGKMLAVNLKLVVVWLLFYLMNCYEGLKTKFCFPCGVH